MQSTLAIVLLCAGQAAEPGAPRFVEAAAESGLGGLAAARVCLADVNGDGRPDAVIDRHRVFLNREDAGSPHGVWFEEIRSGLPAPRAGDCCVFADLDNDGNLDAVFTRYLDVNNEAYEPPAEGPERTAWLRGNGDGTFGEPRVIEAAKPATTAAVAVGDVDRDGLPDLWLGNWYVKYGASNEGFTNDLLLQTPLQARGRDGAGMFERRALGEDRAVFDEESDAAGRPTYGVMIARVLPSLPYAKPDGLEQGIVYPGYERGEPPPPQDRRPELIELNYGRRWNRLLDWGDVAPRVGFDGDDIRHGRYPAWLKERAKTDPRFDRPDEKPFRANGNTFDASIGDVDNDGDWDIFLAEITHAWAGESSDRSRLLLGWSIGKNTADGFTTDPRYSVDRIPPEPPAEERPEGWVPRWNQGDLYCELADLDHDGWLDLLLSSGDYPDPPPYDQRLRVFLHRGGGTREARFVDVTAAAGIDHPGSGQIAVGDVDLDGDLDVLAGQSFMRWTQEMIAAHPEGEPRVRLFLNRTADDAGGGARRSITLELVGDPGRGVARDALGAIVRLTATINGKTIRQSRQLIGIGGHAGKQHEFLVHFGLGDAERADRVEIDWPTAEEVVSVMTDVPAGRHVVRLRPAEGASAGNP